MAERTQISLLNFAADTQEDAEIVDAVSVSEVKAAQRQWSEYLQATPGVDTNRIKHSHWDWFRKARYT